MSDPSDHDDRSVKIAGRATVAQAAGIRDRLAAAVMQSGELTITIEADEVDVSLIQLLVAARRSVLARGGSLHLAHPPSGALLEALTQGGFLHHGAQDALWATGVSQ